MTERKYWPSAGLGHVGSYQVSAEPFLKNAIAAPASNGTAIEITFPRITRWITVKNETAASGTDLRFGFSAAGISGSAVHYVNLGPQESYTGEWKVQSVFLLSATTTAATGSVAAGLTSIPASVLDTNSNWSGSLGVG